MRALQEEPAVELGRVERGDGRHIRHPVKVRLDGDPLARLVPPQQHRANVAVCAAVVLGEVRSEALLDGWQDRGGVVRVDALVTDVHLVGRQAVGRVEMLRVGLEGEHRIHEHVDLGRQQYVPSQPGDPALAGVRRARLIEVHVLEVLPAWPWNAERGVAVVARLGGQRDGEAGERTDCSSHVYGLLELLRRPRVRQNWELPTYPVAAGLALKCVIVRSRAVHEPDEEADRLLRPTRPDLT